MSPRPARNDPEVREVLKRELDAHAEALRKAAAAAAEAAKREPKPKGGKR